MENEFQPNILVISGGGPRGIAFVGALTELENKTTFDSSKIKILAGSSIGGIICFALCVGYTLLEMKNWFETYYLHLHEYSRVPLHCYHNAQKLV